MPLQKIIISVCICSVLAILVHAKLRTQQKPRPTTQTIATNSNKPSSEPINPVTFQPEGQMLLEALNEPGQANSQNNKSPDSFDPFPVPKNVPTYTYNTNACRGVTAPYLCLAAYYKGLVSDYGSEVAIIDIKQRYTENPDVVSQCHPIMHVIGKEASKSYTTVSEAYEHGDNFCWSGYYHGIMEGVVEKIGTNNLASQLDTICADIPGKVSYNFDYYNCLHGLGHGIMELENDEVFDSLKMCNNLSGDWEQNSCYSGVYMENIIAYGYNGTSKYLKATDPMYPCDAVDDRYKEQCYFGQSSFALETTRYNFVKVFGMCAQVTPQAYRDVCNQSMGRDAASQGLHDAGRTKANCWLASDANDRSNCVTGAVKEMVSYYHSNLQAQVFCNMLDKSNKAVCNSTASSYYRAL